MKNPGKTVKLSRNIIILGYISLVEPHHVRTVHTDSNLYMTKKMRFIASIATALALGHGTNAAFGLTSTSSRFVIDTDGGLVFEVNKYICTALPPIIWIKMLMHSQIQWRHHEPQIQRRGIPRHRQSLSHQFRPWILLHNRRDRQRLCQDHCQVEFAAGDTLLRR